MTATQPACRCPFFGRVAVPTLQLLAERGTDNCALNIGPRLLPCKMRAAGKEPDWTRCDENTGASWKNEMLKWADNGQRERMLIDFKYPD
jgi:hypothetical protein